jgi:3-hydroxyisobutyrate dehydrogenase-like beta-hydroxyacid dehydrogenase
MAAAKTAAKLGTHALGWIGTGRMGFPMAARLAKAGGKLAAYNRTRSKAEPLTEYGATIVDSPADLADRDIVFTMVSASDDLLEVTLGAKGVLSRNKVPNLLIDCSSVSQEASAQLRQEANKRGVQFLAAPVSGNGKVVKAGLLSVVVSGPKDAFDTARPYLEALGTGASYVGDGEAARLMKICHNVLLGVTIQALVEITVLAEKAGVKRAAFLEFINKSVMGSMFTRYKTPSLVNLDWTPTFTPPLLKKDMDLGLAAAHKLGVPMHLASTAREIIQSVIGHGHITDDFATLLLLQAKNSGIDVTPENVKVSDGLS